MAEREQAFVRYLNKALIGFSYILIFSNSTFFSPSFLISLGLKLPFSVMMAVIYFAGVTSNAGFATFTLSGAICVLPKMCVTSIGFLSSIGINSPDGIDKSIVDVGAAT